MRTLWDEDTFTIQLEARVQVRSPSLWFCYFPKFVDQWMIICKMQ